jgi:mono/diheme cytochrome c family protein
MFGVTVARWVLCANVALALSDSVLAQDLDTGRIEFLSKCATCHGADGKGDGPFSSKLKTKPPNLTTLAKRNKGVFSRRAVYDAVDGRKATGSHRIAEMPIWGCRHAPPSPGASQKSARKRGGHDTKKGLSEQQKLQEQQNRPAAILDLACDPEPVIRSRILAVVEHLRRIQEK